jgi:hypothetical protein
MGASFGEAALSYGSGEHIISIVRVEMLEI